MEYKKVIEAYKQIGGIELSPEAKVEKQIAVSEIQSYDESDIPLQKKTQAIETFGHYATCNFISRQLDEGKDNDEIKSMKVDKKAVEDTLDTIHLMINLSRWGM